MRQFLALALAGLAVTACSDHVTAPTSSLHPAAAANELSDPPPPPIGGDGFADFSTDGYSFLAVRTASIADTPVCTPVHTTFTFSYKYLLNSQDNNAFLHINPDDPSRNVTIHQTANKIDAHGVIVGPGFTYTITDATGGHIIAPEQRLPGGVTVGLIGRLKFDDGTSCTTGASLMASLSGQFVGQ